MTSKRKGRGSFLGCPPRGALPHPVLSLCLLSLFPVFSLGCTPETSVESSAPVETPEPERKVAVRLEADSGLWPLRSIDIFVYADTPTRPLEAFLSLKEKPAGPVELALEPGDKTIVALGNSPWEYRLEALSRLDALEQLSMRYDEEDGARPLLSGSAALRAKEGASVLLRLDPLLCPVRIVSVNRAFSGDLRIEEPAVHLERVNASAEVLRRDGFRPVELLSRGSPMHDPSLLEQALPCDIGYFTQYPGTQLQSYPNDESEPSAGTPRTLLVLEGRIGGEACRWETELPPVRRGHGLNVEWSISGPKAGTVRISDFLLYLSELSQCDEDTFASRASGRVSGPP